MTILNKERTSNSLKVYINKKHVYIILIITIAKLICKLMRLLSFTGILFARHLILCVGCFCCKVKSRLPADGLDVRQIFDCGNDLVIYDVEYHRRLVSCFPVMGSSQEAWTTLLVYVFLLFRNKLIFKSFVLICFACYNSLLTVLAVDLQKHLSSLFSCIPQFLCI